MPVEFKDEGLLAINRNISELSKLRLTIGWQGEEAKFRYPAEGAGKGPTLATVATWMEFGVPGTSTKPPIPARPTLRSTLFTQRDAIVQVWAKAVGRMITNERITAMQTMALVGINVAKMVELRIDTSYTWAKPNAPKTIKKKGFDYPLHETDKMANSVTWEIRRGKRTVLARGTSRG